MCRAGSKCAQRIRILTALDEATHPSHMALPGWRLHRLKGDRGHLWSVRVSANWRVVSGFDGSEAVDVDLTRVVNRRAGVSPRLALALERLGWSDAGHWVRMQGTYDLARARRAETAA